MAELITETLQKELTAIRHKLHQHPELSGHEVETTRFLTQQLRAHGIKIVPTELATGVIAEIGDATKGPTIALRADIDALPITEATGLPFASKNPGVMHACGHDLHQTSLLGAAFLLQEQAADLNGLVRLIFQPAEETHRGAQQVIAADQLKNVAAIIGYHNHPKLKVGQIGLRPHGIMAGVDQFAVKITGVGAHAATPQSAIDPIVTTAAIIQNLQTIISRNFSPLSTGVVSITHIESGNTWNVLPATAFFEGTIRTFSDHDRALAKRRFYQIVEQTAALFGAQATIEWLGGPAVTNNDPALTQLVWDESKTFAETIEVEPATAGEDFATYQQVIPGVFAFIGSNGAKDASDWHHDDFIVRDEMLPIAVMYYVKNAIRLLHELPQN